MDQAPYPVALVELDDKTRITCQMVDYSENTIAMGLRVIVVIRRVMQPGSDGVIPYGVKAKPLV